MICFEVVLCGAAGIRVRTKNFPILLDILYCIQYNIMAGGDIMDYPYIKNRMERLTARKIPKSVLESFELAFDIEYTHHSTAM